MQWSFSDVGSARSQLLSFEGSSDDGQAKVAGDRLAPSGSMTLSGLDVERNRFGDKQAGSYYLTAAYPRRNSNARPIFRPQEARTFPSPKRLGQVTFAPPASVPLTSTPLVGFTDSRNATRSPAAPAQLTIFFRGSVHVFDDVSPEKARAIMSLAGNGSSAPITPVTTRPVPVDDLNGSGRSSMLSFSAVPSNKDQRRVTPKAITSVAPARPTIFPAVALPQARKASLARFLEKRRERAMSMSPYALGKRSPDHTDSASASFSRSTNSAASCHKL